MRYTRNRQLKKANEDYFHELIKKNFPIGFIKTDLDPTFKWHREYNNVSFNTKIYYPHEHITKLFVDLYRQDSVYY
ncbi:hypothetical protein CON62_22270 [Bacillus toyonensis]|nr:hypothetical protein CON62_22270 [Bacillus toyonensis]